MAGIGRTPLPIFVGAFFSLLFAVFIQLKRPFLSDLNTTYGTVTKFETKKEFSDKNELLLIFINDEMEPFISSYPGSYRPFINGNYINQQIYIWFDSDREIHQMSIDGTIIIKHGWFLYWNLILVAIMLAFHFGAFYETKVYTINIKTYWSMWEYAFGAKKPIMKHNRRTYNPNDTVDHSWFDDLFITKESKANKIKNQLTLWQRFFKLCNIRSLTPEVKEWMNQSPNGKEFLEGFSLFSEVIQIEASKDKIVKTTNNIFDFLSNYLDIDREHYSTFGRLFKEKYPIEYKNFINEMDKLR